MPVKELRWFISTFVAPRRWEEVSKNVWMFKPGKRSEQLWQLTKKNDKLRDIRSGKTVAKKQPVQLDRFSYAFVDNAYVHKPTGLVLSSRELNALFPRETWPTLNGAVRRPSNFIRRHQRVMYLSDLGVINDGFEEKPIGKSARATGRTEGVPAT